MTTETTPYWYAWCGFWLAIFILSIATGAFAQGMQLPPADDPWWETPQGEEAATEAEIISEYTYGCQPFRDNDTHAVSECEREASFFSDGEVADLMNLAERQRYEMWVNYKQACLHEFCEEEKLKGKCNVCR
jgi:hypothetical protein